jgi:hypothetical protein
LKPIVYDSLIIACVCADIGLILFLMKEIIFPDLDNLFLFLTPVILFGVSLVASQRKVLFQRKPVKSGLLTSTALLQQQVLEEARSVGEKKKFKPSPAPTAKLEFAMHNCPEHGPERCAGNYMNLHSCNTPSSSATQVYWEEKSTEPSRKKRVSSAAAL